MSRIRLFTPDDPTELVGWRIPSLIIATLFLNVPFWFIHDGDFWGFRSLPIAAIGWSTAALLCAALYFLGPALRAQTERSFPAMLAATFGPIPSAFVQIVCLIYVVIWTSKLLALTCWWIGSPRSPWSPLQTAALATAILTVATLTAWQRIRITAALARVSIHLGAAVLVAALIRVRSGWSAIPIGFETSSTRSLPLDLWWGFSNLSYDVAPLAILAAAFASRLITRKSVATTALMGIVLPLGASMVIITALNIATHASSLYRPSGAANIAMALMSGMNRNGEKAVLIIFALTILGLLRFGVTAIKQIPARPHWLIFACLFSATIWCSAHADRQILQTLSDLSTETLAAVAAILTADSLRTPRRPNGSATVALLMAPAISAICRFWWPDLNEETWHHGWLLPTYGIAFLSTALLRLLSQQACGTAMRQHARMAPRATKKNGN